MVSLSMREARRLMIGAQQLAGPLPKRVSKARMLETIRRLGALQIDSISVVQRSHHLVLWSRLGNHPADWLEELHGRDRALFEYWVHAAAYAPIELFPHFRRDMLEYYQRTSSAGRNWSDNNQDVLSDVMAFVAEHGEVSSTSFAAPENAERPEPWAWYGNKPTNVALEVLWRMGDLMVVRRDKFQRVYDLRERVVPDWHDDHLPTIDETDRALGLAAVNALGVTTGRWLPDYYRRKTASHKVPGMTPRETLEALVEEGTVVRGSIKDFAEPVYVSTQALEQRFKPSRTTLLSPFDNLIWDRRRTSQMFDFEIVFEPYVPPEKRVYGYFTLVILHRDQLVGRLDPKAHRSTGELAINSIHLEPWFIGKDDERFYLGLAASLLDFSAFNGTDHVSIGVANPPEARTKLLAALSDAARQ